MDMSTIHVKSAPVTARSERNQSKSVWSKSKLGTILLPNVLNMAQISYERSFQTTAWPTCSLNQWFVNFFKVWLESLMQQSYSNAVLCAEGCWYCNFLLFSQLHILKYHTLCPNFDSKFLSFKISKWCSITKYYFESSELSSINSTPSYFSTWILTPWSDEQE